jgi:hypothetical protein
MDDTSLDELAAGNYERCALCRRDFLVLDGKLQRFKGPDGLFYCGPDHASVTHGVPPTYLTPRKRVAGL